VVLEMDDRYPRSSPFRSPDAGSYTWFMQRARQEDGKKAEGVIVSKSGFNYGKEGFEYLDLTGTPSVLRRDLTTLLV
jgi:hypothetical protein